MTKVRTTLRPDVELDVGPQEYTDLSRQGLLMEGKGQKAPDLTGTNQVLPVSEGTD